ncbi:MAG: hypothetical protein AAGD06_03965 [Acidobacteriota bacterium]
MKKREVSKELVQKTVDTLGELENAVLDIKTGVTAGGRLDDFPSPAPDYGCPDPCYID